MTAVEAELRQPMAGVKSRERPWLVTVLTDPLLWLFALIVVTGILSSDYYLGPQNIQNLMRSMAVLGILALGMTLVLLTGRIDLSVGATMIFSVVVGVQLLALWGDLTGVRMIVRGNTFNGPSVPLVVISVLVGGLVGLINGIGIAYGRIAPFIMTLAMLTGLRGLNYVLTEGHPYYIQSPGYSALGDKLFLSMPLSAWIYFALFLVLAWMVGQTVFGRRLYAIGGDEKTARYAGINVQFWIVTVFVASGLCAGLAGVLFTARLKSVDAPLATGYELTAIAIAVIGGTTLSGGQGSPYRTVCGGLVLAAGLNLLTLWGVSTWTQNIVIGVVLVAAVALAEAMRRRQRTKKLDRL